MSSQGPGQFCPRHVTLSARTSWICRAGREWPARGFQGQLQAPPRSNLSVPWGLEKSLPAPLFSDAPGQISHTAVPLAVIVLVRLASLLFQEHPVPSCPRVFVLSVGSACHSSGLSKSWSLLIIHRSPPQAVPSCIHFPVALVSPQVDFLQSWAAHPHLLCLARAPGARGPSCLPCPGFLGTVESQ